MHVCIHVCFMLFQYHYPWMKLNNFKYHYPWMKLNNIAIVPFICCFSDLAPDEKKKSVENVISKHCVCYFLQLHLVTTVQVPPGCNIYQYTTTFIRSSLFLRYPSRI